MDLAGCCAGHDMLRGALTMFGALTALFTGSNCATTAQDFDAARRRMVETPAAGLKGCRSTAVLQAMGRVPRHLFVPPELSDRAYENSPLSIGLGQTISQPYIVAYMTEALQLTRDHAVLEIGTGSGYQAAVLAELAREVLTIEIVPPLADRARAALNEAGYSNLRCGPATATWDGRSGRRSSGLSSRRLRMRFRRRSSTSSPSAASWSRPWEPRPRRSSS